MQVITLKGQKHGPWFEGSLLGQAPEFRSYCHIKTEYDEIGPSIAKTEIIWHGLLASTSPEPSFHNRVI